jgi:hypothetical protein
MVNERELRMDALKWAMMQNNNRKISIKLIELNSHELCSLDATQKAPLSNPLSSKYTM